MEPRPGLIGGAIMPIQIIRLSTGRAPPSFTATPSPTPGYPFIPFRPTFSSLLELPFIPSRLPFTPSRLPLRPLQATPSLSPGYPFTPSGLPLHYLQATTSPPPGYSFAPFRILFTTSRPIFHLPYSYHFPSEGFPFTPISVPLLPLLL